MSIIQWNCRGIASSAEELKSLFRESEVKVMCLQETKLGNKPYNPGLNYSFHRSPQLLGERAQGGNWLHYSQIHPFHYNPARHCTSGMCSSDPYG